MSETPLTTPRGLEIQVEHIFGAPHMLGFSGRTDPHLIPESWGDGTFVEAAPRR